MFTNDNWYRWSFDGVEFGRPNAGDAFYTAYSVRASKSLSLRDGLLFNAAKTLEVYKADRLNIMLSGGGDSDAVIRAYHELKADFDVTIFEYEDHLNVYDVGHAIELCRELGLKYTLIPFNLRAFYRSERPLELCMKTGINRPRALPYLAFLDMLDGVPVLASSEPMFVRPIKDYSTPTTWGVLDLDYEVLWDWWPAQRKQKAIMQWFKFTPELCYSWLNTEWFKALTSDKIQGKLSSTSTKIMAFQEAYPDMVGRKKKTGFEHVEDEIARLEAILTNLNTGINYRQQNFRTVDEYAEELRPC